ncbi:MAG: SdpI family protein [Actinomycetota bacterium]
MANLFVGNAIVAAVSIPLIFRWIGPNSWYGFRTARTLADRETWFAVNAFCGWALLIASLVSAVVLVFGRRSLVTRGWLALVVFVVPVMGAIVASSIHLWRFG